MANGGGKLERSVLMEKERLYISRERVEVEYEFRNTGAAPVVSEVAFPIASYSFDLGDLGGSAPDPGFTLWVDGKPVTVSKEIRAFVKGKEVTKELNAAGIAIDAFGNYPSENNQLALLSPQVRKRLVQIRALEDTKTDDRWERWSPAWEVGLKYYWRQEFPVGKVVKIKHSYYPLPGSNPAEIKDLKQLNDACPDRATLTAL